MVDFLGSGSYLSDDVEFLLQAEIKVFASNVDALQRVDERDNPIGLYPENQPTSEQLGAFLLAMKEKNLSQLASITRNIGDFLKEKFSSSDDIVLVSLVPSGVPIGVLLKRYISQTKKCTHYAISFIRGIGIDYAALNHVIHHHGADNIVFVTDIANSYAAELASGLWEYPELFDGEQNTLRLVAIAGEKNYCWNIVQAGDVLIPASILGVFATGLVSGGYLRESVDPILTVDDFSNPDNWHKCIYFKYLKDYDLSRDFVARVYNIM